MAYIARSFSPPNKPDARITIVAESADEVLGIESYRDRHNPEKRTLPRKEFEKALLKGYLVEAWPDSKLGRFTVPSPTVH